MVWFYHGLVPKLLLVHQSELDIWLDLGLSADSARTLVIASGVVEVVFAVLVVVYRHHRWPFILSILAMAGLLIGVAAVDPSVLGGSYNPVGVNLAMITLALIALAAMKGGEGPTENCSDDGGVSQEG